MEIPWLILLVTLGVLNLLVAMRLLGGRRFSHQYRWSNRWGLPRHFGPSYLGFLGQIERLESQTGVRLSPEAREMLFLPLHEFDRLGEFVDWGTALDSIHALLISIREDRADQKSFSRGEAMTRALIRALHKRYCNIPPFCERTDEMNG